MDDRQLAVFARAPRKGLVKTRLASELGATEALRIYENLLHGTLRRLRDAPFGVWLYAEGDGLEETAAHYGMALGRQVGQDLGERMANALRELLWTGRRAAIVGVDIPLLDAGYVRSAFDRLEHSDLVLGPTEDGGYCLIALSRMREQLFQDVDWGTSGVLEKTRSIAAGLGLAVSLTPTLWDLDRIEDVHRLREVGSLS